MTNNKSGQVVWYSFDENRKGETAKAYFDEIIDDFASMKGTESVALISIFV